jgi:hypothetical protein
MFNSLYLLVLIHWNIIIIIIFLFNIFLFKFTTLNKSIFSPAKSISSAFDLSPNIGLNLKGEQTLMLEQIIPIFADLTFSFSVVDIAPGHGNILLYAFVPYKLVVILTLSTDAVLWAGFVASCSFVDADVVQELETVPALGALLGVGEAVENSRALGAC